MSPSARCKELKSRLDALVEQVDSTDLAGEEHLSLGQVVTNFVAGGAVLLDEATPFLWDYYSSFASGFSAGERRAYGIPELGG